MEEKIYDILIVGGGPGGITAAIYAKRAGMDVAIIEKSIPGGAVTTTSSVSNFLGQNAISGMELATKFFEHASSLDIEFIWDEVKSINLKGDLKEVECYSGKYVTKAVILAFGASVKHLNATNERDFIGKGVSYCATCDGSLYKDEVVAIVGGGNTAVEDALYLSNIVKKLYVIHRRDTFRADKVLIDSLKEKENVQFILNSTITKVLGDKKIESIDVLDKISNTTQNLKVGGLFVCIGRGPDTDILSFDIEKDEGGYIVTDKNMKTSVDGVYAVGDIRNTPLRQIITAASDGAIAATKATQYIKTKKV